MQIRCVNCFELYDDRFEVCHHCGHVPGDPARELNHLYPGMILNSRYIVGQVLGFGGFGITYKVWDQRLSTVLAIKEYYPGGLVNRVPGTKNVILFTNNRQNEYAHGMARFLEEARSMAKFSSHKSIINVFDFFEENNTAYIVMEYLEGITLSAFLKNNRLDLNGSISLILHICAALKDIHAAGIIHRDVSPDNIFLCTNNLIKLIDFGAARFYADEERQLTIILKPGFAPPEQYEGVNIQGPWTDIYALGATLFLMVTGVKPEESTNRKIADTLTPPIELDDHIPEHISNTIMKAMAIDKHLRFSSVAEFEKALNNERKVLPVAKERKKRRRRRFATVFASVLIIAISVGIFLFYWNQQKLDMTLPDASISFWYPLSGDIILDEAKENAFAAIIEEFSSSFPNVNIEVKAFPQESYMSSLQDAIYGGTGPTLFESTGIDGTVLENAADLSGVVELLDSRQYLESQPCNFYNNYAVYFTNKNQIPLGFVAPVIYLNTTLLELDDSGVRDIHVLTSHELVLNNADKQAFVAAFGDAAVEFTDDAKEIFLTGRAASFFADTTAYFEVQEALPARYKLLFVDSDAVIGSFSDLWSIGICGDNERKAAERLLLFMLSDYAQDYLYVRNRSEALPINKNILNLYSSIYNDFDGFFNNIRNYEFIVQN